MIRSRSRCLAGRAAVARALDELGWVGDPDCAQSFFERLRGFTRLGRMREDGEPEILVFPHCRALHTCFMRCELDIAFADACGSVLRLEEGVGPGRFLFCFHAEFALERRAGAESGNRRPCYFKADDRATIACEPHPELFLKKIA